MISNTYKRKNNELRVFRQSQKILKPKRSKIIVDLASLLTGFALNPSIEM